MRTRFAFVVTLTATWIVSPAMAADFVLTISAGEEQCQRFNDGWKVIDDGLPLSAVRIRQPREAHPKQGGFQVYVSNNGDRPFNFGPENISIKFGDGTSIAMLTYDNLMEQQRKRESNQRFWTAMAVLGRSLQTSDAGYTSGTVTYSGQSFGSIGSTPFHARTSGMGTYSSYDSGAAYAAQSLAYEQSQRDIQAMQLNQAARRVELAQVMKMTTVDSGHVYGGIVQYMVPKPVQSSKAQVPISIEIRTGDEVHSFQATIAKAGKSAPVSLAGTRQSEPAHCVRHASPPQVKVKPLPVAPEHSSPAMVRQVSREPQPQLAPQNGLAPNAGVRCITCR